MTKNYPHVEKLSYSEFAIVDITVALEEPIEGNSGQSSIRFHVDGGSIWLDDEEQTPESVRDFTIRLRGENEHSIIARAFREAAEILDPS